MNGFPWWPSGKSACNAGGKGLIPGWGGQNPWSRKWQLTPVFLPGKSHEQRSLAGYSPWGRKRLREFHRNCKQWEVKEIAAAFGNIFDCCLVAKSCPTLCDPLDYTVHCILQARILENILPSPGIFSIQGSNPGLTRCGKTLYQLSHQGNPIILEWVACLVCRRSSRPRNESGSPALQADSLPAELRGKPSLLLPPPFPL